MKGELNIKMCIRSVLEYKFRSYHDVFRVVEFASSADMRTAIEKLDDTDLSGRRIRLVEDKRRNGGGSRRRSRSSSSRSRSRSRRRSR